MGRRGPRPKPTALKILEGNPGRRTLRSEPQAPRGEPPMPTWLDAEGRAEWRRLCDSLALLGLLCTTDRGCLAILCDLWSESVRLTKRLRRMPVAESGGVRAGRIASQLRTSMQMYVKIAREFGLTPAARIGLPVGAAPAADNFEQFISRDPGDSA